MDALDRRVRAPSPSRGAPTGAGSSSLTSGGLEGFPSEVSYGAAKAALENFTMSAAFELASRGSRPTSSIRRSPTRGWLTPQIRAQASPRRAQPEDVARVIAMLCSPAAEYVSGNVIRMR